MSTAIDCIAGTFVACVGPTTPDARLVGIEVHSGNSYTRLNVTQGELREIIAELSKRVVHSENFSSFDRALSQLHDPDCVCRYCLHDNFRPCGCRKCVP